MGGARRPNLGAAASGDVIRMLLSGDAATDVYLILSCYLRHVLPYIFSAVVRNEIISKKCNMYRVMGLSMGAAVAEVFLRGS